MQKFSHKHKQSGKQVQKQRAVGRSFEIEFTDDEFEDEEEVLKEKLEENEEENSPIDVFDEDENYEFESDFQWTSLKSHDKPVSPIMVLMNFPDGVKAFPISYSCDKNGLDEKTKLLKEIVERINNEGFQSFEEMEGKFVSSEFGNDQLFRQVITNNYALLEPYGRAVKLNFLTSKGRRTEEIDESRLYSDMKYIFDEGYTRKGEIAERLVQNGYPKSIQRREEFKKAYERLRENEE